MNIYSLLPLAALFANLFLCFYTLYLNPNKRLNQLFSLSIFCYALMAFANYFMFNASSVNEAIIWNKTETIGSVMSTIFLFHFSLVFCHRKLAKNKLFLSLLYLSGILFLAIEFSTNLITETMNPVYFGYSVVPADVYGIMALFLSFLIILSMLVCWQFYQRTSNEKEKKQAKLLIIAFSFPIIGGISTQAIAPFISFEIMPLTAIFSTFTAFIISYSIFRYNLLKPLTQSIQRKILTMFFVLLLCLIFFTLSTVRIISTETIEETISNDLRAVAQSRANSVKMIINQDLERLSFIANRTDLQNAFLEYINNETEIHRNRMRTILIDTNKTIADYEDIIIINNTGRAIVSTNPIYENESYDEKEYYINSRTKKNLVLSRIENDIRIIISGPFMHSDELLGTIVAISSTDTIYSVISDYTGLGETGEIYIVNESGVVITPLRFYNNSNNRNHIILEKKINTENVQNCFTHAYLSDEEIQSHHDEIEIFKDYRNTSVLGTHVYIADMNWALLAEIDEREAFASVDNMQMILTILFTISGMIILVIAYFYSKTISKPIKRLNHVANEITKGNLNNKVKITTSDEIGNLAQSFNIMTKSLKNYTETLEHKVEQRTQDLQEKIDELEQFKKVTVGRELKMVELKDEIKHLKEQISMEYDRP